MPGKQSLVKQQYYGNPRNHFWPIIGQLLQVEVPEDYCERIALLKKREIGLWDTIEACEREGSLDAAIRNEKPNDFQTLFETYPNIKLVLFNGAKAIDVFKKHIGLELLAGRAIKKCHQRVRYPGKILNPLTKKLRNGELYCHISQ